MIWALIGSKPLRLAVGALAALLAYEGWKFHQRGIGAEKAVTTIEKANDNATKLGGNAAARSLDKRVRGQRDPTTRDD